jgi:tetratricopeptide (TPR) repeat protein
VRRSAASPARSATTTILATLLALAPLTARADRIDEAWKRGNDAYFRGDYPAAAAAYEQLDRQGIIAADLSYNLGVAYFRQGQLGRAIWAFERAAALDPEAEDARFNLVQARKVAERRALDKIEGAEREAAWIRVVTVLPTSAQTWIFLLVYGGCFALLFWRRRVAAEARATVGAGAAILAVTALLAGGLLIGRSVLERIPFGIVLPDGLAVKEGADPNYRTSFEVHAGLRVRLLERDQDWVRIRLANGLEGWVRDQDVGRL